MSLAAQKIAQFVDVIANEIQKQDELWGEQNHSPLYWSGILSEETGEVSKYAIEQDVVAEFDELIHVAAVAINAMASLVRQGFLG